MERIINTFSGGQVQDIDPHNQKNNTARYINNGRVRYNVSDDSSLPVNERSRRGMTFAFSNEKGNYNVNAVCNTYETVGFKDVGDSLLLFSTQGSGGYSQIGVFTISDDLSETSYTILYDDRNDPNGDRLNLKTLDEDGARILEVEYCDENEFIKRVYFNDGYNQERVFNLQLMYQEYNCVTDCEAITTLTPYHVASSPCGKSSAPYPKFLSVHAFDSRMDLVYPVIDFKQRIDGFLKRGVYQYAMRYVAKDGHKSTWSLITRHIVVTGTHYPDHPEYLHNVAGSGYSHHNREMSATNNDASTNDGLRISLTGIDTRWDSFEVAYIYSKTDTVSHEANVFYVYDNQCGAVPMPESVNIDHTQHTGYPVAFAEFSQTYQTILSQQTFVQKQNRLYRGNLELLPPFDVEGKTISIKPKFRYLLADETLEPKFISKANPKTQKNDADVLTNSQPVTTSFDIDTFNGNSRTIEINDDYNNYKGQQVEHSLAGYRRGDTYGYAVVIYDRKGNPSFAYHLDDYTFPEQYDISEGEECSLTKSINGRWNLRIMGASISGLKIPKKCIYDKFGKLNVSGFAIVRTENSGKILHQGIILPCIDYSVGACGTIISHVQAAPHPLLSNKFFYEYYDGTNHRMDSNALLIRHTSQEDHNREECSDYIDAIMGYGMYYSPDVMFEGQFNLQKDSDVIKHVGSCHKAYATNEIPLDGSELGSPTYNHHRYTKSYDTSLAKVNGNTPYYTTYGRKKVGEESRLQFGFLVDQSQLYKENFDEFRTDMTFLNSDLDMLLPITGGPNRKVGFGVGVNNSVVLGMKDFEHVDITYADSTSSYRIVNYIRPKPGYVTPDGDNSFDVRKYISTGHFQPLTADVVANAEAYAQDKGDDENLWFDNIEVWGGDCFVNLFDFTRIVPETIENCDQEDNMALVSGAEIEYLNNGSMYKEFATSMIVPLESKYNLALRFGRHFAKNATYAQQAYCDNTKLQFAGGIMSLQPENFDINRVLLHQENIQFFSTKPQDIRLVSTKRSSYYASMQKVYSELDDSYRKQRVFDYYDLQGNAGDIVKFITLFNYIYCFQEFGYGILRTAERAIVPSSAGELLLGTGKDLDGIDYISTEFGCQHAASIFKFKNAVYWVDARRGVISRHSQAGKDDLSNNYGLHDATTIWCPYFDRRTTPDTAIIGGVDYENSDVFFTFISQRMDLPSRTIAFNEDLNIFHGDKPFIPSLYVNHRNLLFTVNSAINDKHRLYLHGHGKYGQFYGVYYKSVLEFIVNPNAAFAKVFDNGRINIEQSGVKRIGKIYLETEESSHELYGQQSNVISDSRIQFKEGLLRFPYFELNAKKPRLRGQYLIVRLEIDNQNQQIDGEDIPVRITSWETTYRFSARI